MASKKVTDQDLDQMFEGIGIDDHDPNAPAKDATPKTDTVTDKSTAKPAHPDEDDPLAELRNLAVRPAATSRSSTPHVSTISSSAASIRKNTPPSSRSGRSSEEKPAVADSNKAQTTDAQQDSTDKASSGASWWGGISSFATAAVKQARGAVEEIQKNEEAAKWAEQVRGNYGTLRGLGDDLRTRALPTFTTLLHTLAPPISQHERLQIHISHDIMGYPSLDPLIYQTFSRVMSQVEGGDLLVIQRGYESAQRRPSEGAYSGGGTSGWTAGPWWRSADEQRSLNAVSGLVEGSKLARASAEGYATEHYAARGGVEEAAKQATASMSESNPTRSSDIFLSVQAISHTMQSELFSGNATQAEQTAGDKVVIDESSQQADRLITFAVYLHDPVHSIRFSSLSQPFPQRWADWMDASSPAAAAEGSESEPPLPGEIADIINGGGIDPREWVSEWMEETLTLAMGVVAQRYVARRMGVGEGSIGRGKRREEIVESGGGEAARAI